MDASPKEERNLCLMWGQSVAKITRARIFLESGDERSNLLLVSYFGSSTPDTRAAVLQTLRKMEQVATTERYALIVFRKIPASLSHHIGVSAYTRLNSQRQIFINRTHARPGFETRRVLLHELSHNAAHTEDFAYLDTQQTFTDFGRSTSTRTAYWNTTGNVAMTPGMCVRNADSYAHFIENNF